MIRRRFQTVRVIVIAKARRRVARVASFPAGPAHRTPGSARGLVQLASDFDDPLPEDIWR